MMTKEEVCKNLIYYLIDNDMTVEALSNKIGASKASVYRWINLKPMRNQYYIKLLKLMENYTPSAWVIEKKEDELNDYMFS